MITTMVRLIMINDDDDECTDPGDNIVIAGRAGIVDGLAPGDELEEEDAEGVYVGFERELACHGILWSAISVGSHHSGGDMGFVSYRA